MKTNQFVYKEINGDVCRIWLNRPDKGNAMNNLLIRELNQLIVEVSEDTQVRYVVLGGKGNNFCSGADLVWMKKAGELNYEDNLKESLELAELYHQIFYSAKIFIARITGACYGGGIGLAAACDFVMASDDSTYAFSEVRLGLVPATIAPYVVHRTGGHKARQVMLTGDALSAAEMKSLGIVDVVVGLDRLDDELEKLIKKLSLGGKRAQHSIKQLISDLENITDWRDVKHYTAEILARARSSAEGKEGLLAFIEKRRPNWD